MSSDFDDDASSSVYSRKVGERLRVIRRQKRLSLQEVESSSSLGYQHLKALIDAACESEERNPTNQECQALEVKSGEAFKASVLGAYERGERAISVPRLERLAKFYNVPVDQLLPREEVVAPAEGEGSSKKLAVDLNKLSQLTGPTFEMLTRFLRLIQVQRQDFNGKVITVRGDDQRAIAAMLDVPVDQVGQRLDALDLLFRP